MSSLQRVREKNLQSVTESKTKAWVRGGTVLSTLAALGALAFFGWKRQRRKSDLPKTRTNAHLQTPTGTLAATFEVPEGAEQQPVPVVLLIAGSGPTDRDGNQLLVRNNALKLLALGLKAEGIASLRYDKRGIGESKAAGRHESDLRFEHLIEDAEAWILQLQADPRFDQVIVAGHSEGSLIGMIAAQRQQPRAFISLAGVSAPAGEIIEAQLQAQLPKLAKKAKPILEQLAAGEPVKKYPLLLHSLFRPSVQPYLMSWLKYDPSQEIQALKQPVLLVQGERDVQVGIENIEELAEACPQAEKVVLPTMNHVLKDVPEGRRANLKTYNQPALPLHGELLPSLVKFIRGL